METNNIEMITKMVIDAINKNEDKGNGFVVPIGVSARHIHLTQEHVEALFGEGYQLTKKKDLMGGQFASNETVTIVGLKLRAIENVRILGPVRSKSQVEVSATDAIKLGMKVPVRMSGDLAGSAPIAVVGPKGAIYLKEGCIVAMRHIHMAPKDARLRVYMMVMLFPSKLTMSAERSLIRLRSVLMTALHWKCILIQMKQMQQELPQAIQLP